PTDSRSARSSCTRSAKIRPGVDIVPLKTRSAWPLCVTRRCQPSLSCHMYTPPVSPASNPLGRPFTSAGHAPSRPLQSVDVAPLDALGAGDDDPVEAAATPTPATSVPAATKVAMLDLKLMTGPPVTVMVGRHEHRARSLAKITQPVREL